MSAHTRDVWIFDLYGTLLDVEGVANEILPAHGKAVATTWRERQLQYTWLRTIRGDFADFDQVTEDALSYALARHGLTDARIQRDLMQAWHRLPPHPDALPALARLRQRGATLAVLSNGSHRMLKASLAAAGLASCFDHAISVEDVRVYKPHPSVYALAKEALGAPTGKMNFVSSNAWDAFSAKAFGFRVLWCNRAGLPPEHLPAEPDTTITSLSELVII